MPRRLPLALLALALSAPAVHADDGPAIYRTLLKSVCWVLSPLGDGHLATGTGTLIDRDRRLILTNYHVVGDRDDVRVLFPHSERGKVVAERDYYLERLRRYALRGRVVARDRKADLALVQLEGLPAGAEALPLSDDGASPGQSVHSVGNPGDSGALWVYTPGEVRQAYHKKWKAKVDGEERSFEADVVETDSAINPGDSGGPLVNGKGRLVGVTDSIAVNARLLSEFIDVSEVKKLLGRRDVKDLKAPEATVKPAERAAEVKDDGHFFSEEAVKKATEEGRELARRYHRDLLVETFPAPPDDQADKVKEMRPAERERFFEAWARERIKAEGLVGVYVLVCREPSHLRVEVARGARSAFDEDFVKRLVKELLAKFKEKEFDQGLAAAVRLTGERLKEWSEPRDGRRD
jgi:hypothetical protein